MKLRRHLAPLLALALLLAGSAAAEETPAAPLRAPEMSRPVAAEAAGTAQESPKPLADLLPGRWSAAKMVAAALASDPIAQPNPTPGFSFVLRNENPRLSLATPFPLDLPPNAFRYGRARGPFEQIYPNLW